MTIPKGTNHTELLATVLVGAVGLMLMDICQVEAISVPVAMILRSKFYVFEKALVWAKSFRIFYITVSMESLLPHFYH